MSRLHISHIVYSFGVGGLENGIVNLINHLDPDQFRFSVCSFTPRREIFERITQKGVHFEVLHKQEGNDWRLPIKLAKLFKQWQVDIVHTHNWATYMEGLVAAKLARVPTFIHGEHGLTQLTRWHRSAAYKLCAPVTDRFFTVSEHLRDKFVDEFHIPAAKVTAITNGVDCQKFYPDPQLRCQKRQEFGISPDTVVLGAVGRLTVDKDYHALLHAVSLLTKRTPPWQLYIIGEGGLDTELLALAKSLGIEKSVHFLGGRDDVNDLLNIVDVFSLTSVREGMPNSILEAMCVNLPIVATDVGGVGEIVVDGQTGLLIPVETPETKPQAIAEALDSLIRSPQRRQELGRAGHKRIVQEFSLDKMVNTYAETYINAYHRRQADKA